MMGYGAARLTHPIELCTTPLANPPSVLKRWRQRFRQ